MVYLSFLCTTRTHAWYTVNLSPNNRTTITHTNSISCFYSNNSSGGSNNSDMNSKICIIILKSN